MEEKVIEKIRKCLALANNNPSEEEAKAAALMAQKLLAKYNISLSDVEGSDVSEEIVEETVWFKDCVKGVARAWKYQLAAIVGKNFRCKYFFYGKSAVAFYGHKTDTQVAAEVFKYLFALGDRLANRVTYRVLREYHKRGQSAQVSGIYNSWVMGFLKGLNEGFDKQSTALMIVIPEDVKKAFVERSQNFGQLKSGMRNKGFDSKAYNDGFAAGKEAMAKRAIEA